MNLTEREKVMGGFIILLMFFMVCVFLYAHDALTTLQQQVNSLEDTQVAIAEENKRLATSMETRVETLEAEVATLQEENAKLLLRLDLLFGEIEDAVSIIHFYHISMDPVQAAQEAAVIVYETLKYDLNPRLVAHVAGWESGFSRDNGNLDEIGRMHMRPSTALWVAQRMGLEDFQVEDLYDPATAYKLGAWYLNYQRTTWGDDITLIVGSYNWGQGNVARAGGTIPDDKTHVLRYAQAMDERTGGVITAQLGG